MKALLRLSWKEFSLPFIHWGPAGCPGGRDFLWLSILLVLVLSQGLLLQGSRIGLLNNFVDVFLGSVEDEGVPVWVIPNPISPGGINLINTEVLRDIRQTGFRVHPYREMEAGFDYLHLPGTKTWRRQDKSSPAFSGWAVYSDDPLWPVQSSPDALPLQIVVNKNRFVAQFDIEAYRNGLVDTLPERLVQRIPSQITSDIDATLKTLWLKVKIAERRDLMPFEIVWVDQIPAMKKLTFLFPLKTYHAFRECNNYPELNCFPELKGGPGKRLMEIAFRRHGQEEIVRRLASRFDGKITNQRGFQVVTFSQPQPKFLIDFLAKDLGATYQALRTIEGDILHHGDGHLLLPCRALPPDHRGVEGRKTCNKNPGYLVRKDVTSTGNGFLRALVYIPDRTRIRQAIGELLAINDGALSIHPIYRDALSRFGFLTKVLEILRVPFGTVLVAFLLALLGIQLGTLIGHRRHRYGIFMAKGMMWWQIYLSVYFQVTLAVIMSSLLAWGMIEAAQVYLLGEVSTVANDFGDNLNLKNLNLLPLAPIDYVIIMMFTLIVAWLIASLILYLTPIRSNTAPGLLLQE